MQPTEKVIEMIEVMGYVKSLLGQQYVFVGEYFVILKRGHAFIEEALGKLRLTQALKEEDI